jgi:hypothetical protein
MAISRKLTRENLTQKRVVPKKLRQYETNLAKGDKKWYF